MDVLTSLNMRSIRMKPKVLLKEIFFRMQSEQLEISWGGVEKALPSVKKCPSVKISNL